MDYLYSQILSIPCQHSQSNNLDSLEHIPNYCPHNKILSSTLLRSKSASLINGLRFVSV